MGDKVWYRRPENSGHKLDSRWLGPCVVKERLSENTYKVEVGPGAFVDAHATFLKLYNIDPYSGDPVTLYKYKRTQKPSLSPPLSDYITIDIESGDE